MKRDFWKYCAVVMLSTTLVGCSGSGGGGISAGPVVSTHSFPLGSAYRSMITNPSTYNFNISGSCNGTGNISTAAANTSVIFETIAGYAAAQTVTMNFTNCTPTSTALTGTNYYDLNYDPLGYSISGGEYGVYLNAPNFPGSVRVGDTGTIGTITVYDSTANEDGVDVVSYVIEPHTASTAIVNFITRSYDIDNNLLLTEQDRYLLRTTGALEPVSTDLQYTSGSVSRLFLSF
jgi:hypothetical protein